MKSERKGERKETQGNSRTCEKGRVSGYFRMHGGGGGDEFPHMCMAWIISSNDSNSGAYVPWVQLRKTC